MGELTVVPRQRWFAAPPKTRPVTQQPATRKGLVVHHNGPPMRLNLALPFEELVAQEAGKVRAVQRFHQSPRPAAPNGWSDFAYSFAVGQSGTIFDGRGVWWNQFANGDDVVGFDNGEDSDWYTVLWLGGGEERPTLAAYVALERLVEWLRSLGAGDRVLPHLDFKPKPCPGPELTGWCRSIDRNPTVPDPGVDDMTPAQAEQLQAIFDALFTGSHGGPTVERIRQIHEQERAVRVEGGVGVTGVLTLTPADVDRVAARTADLLAERLRA